MAIINQVVSGGGSAPETQYGINLKGWCGDMNQAGGIRTDQAVGTLSMPNLMQINPNQFAYKFRGSTGLVGAVNFSSVTTVSDYGLVSAFYNTNITGVIMPNLQSVGREGLSSAFSNTQITTLDIHCSTFVDGENAFYQMCYGCSLLRNLYLYIPASAFIEWVELWSSDDFMYIFENAFGGLIQGGCSNCVVHFYENIWQEWNQWFEDMRGEPSPYETAQDWATAILSYIDGTPQTTNSVVFDISAS